MQHPLGCLDVDLTVAPDHRVQHETVDHRHGASRDVPCQPGSHQLIDVTISPLEERLAKRRLARREQGQLVPRAREGAVAPQPSAHGVVERLAIPGCVQLEQSLDQGCQEAGLAREMVTDAAVRHLRGLLRGTDGAAARADRSQKVETRVEQTVASVLLHPVKCNAKIILHAEKSVKVDIVGGGIAGLAAAAGLQRAGATVTVRERQPDATQNGSGLSLFRNGLAALEALGLADAVRAAAGRSPEYPSGLRLPSGRWMSRFSGRAIADLRIIERQRLHDVLHSQLRPGTVHFSSPVSNDKRSSSTGSGHGAADLVVAADGIRSSLRAGWPDDPGARYAGYFAFRAITVEPVPLDASGETWGAGRRFGVGPLSDGRVYWFATVNGSRDDPPPVDRAALERLFGDWHQLIAAILGATPLKAISLLPIDELSRCPASLWRGNVVLVGDAAHAMTPNLGQGANLALEDAATLVGLLAPYAAQAHPPQDQIRRALEAYQQRRSARVRAIWRRSRQIGTLGQWEHPAAVRIRDAVFSRLPDGSVNAASVTLQSWTPTLDR